MFDSTFELWLGLLRGDDSFSHFEQEANKLLLNNK